MSDDRERALALREQHSNLRDFTTALSSEGIRYQLNKRLFATRNKTGGVRWLQVYVMVEVEDGWQSVGKYFKEPYV